MDAWQKEQAEVWGDGPEWGNAIARLQTADAALDDVADVAKARKDPDLLIRDVLAIVVPDPEAPVGTRVLERFERIRPAVTERLRAAIEFGAVRHALTHTVANAALRGIV